VVINASPLIYLAKINRLDLLTKVFDTIQIAPEVKRECIDAGKRKNYPDAYRIEKFLLEGRIRVHSLSKEALVRAEELANLFKIDIGEAQSIILAKEKKEAQILVDQTHAREAAKFMEIRPRGTLNIILTLVEHSLISTEEAIHLVNALIESNFYISVKIYQKFLEFLKQK